MSTPEKIICKDCSIELPANSQNFRKCSAYSHGFFPRCKECRSIYDRNKRNKNIDRVKKSSSKWRNKNKEYYKAYYKENKEKMVKRCSERYRKRYNNDPEFKMVQIFRRRFLFFIKGSGTSKKVKKYLGCSLDFLKDYLSNMFYDGMSWDNHGTLWHIDHIKPCDSFDLSNMEQQRQCFHYSNLQPLWAKENLKKSNKITEHDDLLFLKSCMFLKSDIYLFIPYYLSYLAILFSIGLIVV
jgi:hypothetical protein